MAGIDCAWLHCGQVLQRLLLVGAAVAMAACSSQGKAAAGADSVNGGYVAISNSGTYDYVLQSGCIGAYQFQLQSDSGSTEWIPQAHVASQDQRGQITLSAGKWRGGWFARSGLIPEACIWAINLNEQ
jgi:hypothetical protein